MSGEATVQVLDTSVDRDGLSIVSATKTVANPRLGSMYHPTLLAAGVPVWFHALNDGTYLALFSKHWEAATVGSGGPQTYSAHTEVTTPTWVVVNPVTGHTTDQGVIPSRQVGTRTLIDACSRTGYLYTLGTVDGTPFIQHHRIDDKGNLVLQSEEVIPDTVVDALTVTWTAGLYIDGFYLVLIGRDGSGHLYRRRKPWGRVGQNNGQDPWTYRSAKGWYASDDPDTLVPEDPEDPTLPDLGGARMMEAEVGPTGTGTATYAKRGDREWLCVKDGSVAKFWSSRMVDSSWKKATLEVPADAVHLQSQLYHNTVSLPEGVDTAVPFVKTVVITTSGQNALQVSWGSLPV